MFFVSYKKYKKLLKDYEELKEGKRKSLLESYGPEKFKKLEEEKEDLKLKIYMILKELESAQNTIKELNKEVQEYKNKYLRQIETNLIISEKIKGVKDERLET